MAAACSLFDCGSLQVHVNKQEEIKEFGLEVSQAKKNNARPVAIVSEYDALVSALFVNCPALGVVGLDGAEEPSLAFSPSFP